MQQLLELLITGVSIGAVYSLIALALNLTFWTSRTVNFATGSLLMFAAMTSIAIFAASGNLLLAIAVGLITVAMIGYVIEIVGVRPILKRGSSIGWMVTTLGFAFVLQALATNLWGAESLSFPAIIFDSSDYLTVFGARISLQYVVIILASLIILGLTLAVLKFSIWGRAMRAVSEDTEAARLLGINTKLVVSASYIASALVAGLAGILIAPITGVEPAFGLELLISGFVVAILGGLGSAIGALIGGLSLGITEELIAGYLSAGLTEAVAFVVLITVLALRPQGLFGDKEVYRL